MADSGVLADACSNARTGTRQLTGSRLAPDDPRQHRQGPGGRALLHLVSAAAKPGQTRSLCFARVANRALNSANPDRTRNRGYGACHPTPAQALSLCGAKIQGLEWELRLSSRMCGDKRLPFEGGIA